MKSVRFKGRVIFPFFVLIGSVIPQLYLFLIMHKVSLWLILASGFLVLLTYHIARTYEQMIKENDRDALTQCYTRKNISLFYRKLLKIAHKSSKKVAIAFIDLDDFKLINDQFGHSTGDLVLKRISNLLRALSSKSGYVVRFGGDEFVVIMLVKDERDLEKWVKHLDSQLIELSNEELMNISLSVGCAIYPEEGQTLQSLLYAADQKMYHNKRTRRESNRIHSLIG